MELKDLTKLMLETNLENKKEVEMLFLSVGVYLLICMERQTKAFEKIAEKLNENKTN